MVLWCGVGVAADTNEIKSLTVEQAKALAKHEGYLLLNGLTSLTPEVAKALGKHVGGLLLDGVTDVDDKTLAILKSNPQITLPEQFR